MISDLWRGTFQKRFHLCCDLVHTVGDPLINNVGRNNFFSWKSGNTVDPDYFSGFFFLIVQSSHNYFQTFCSSCSDLKIIMFSDLAADRFVHLSASDGDLTANDDLAIGYDGKRCTLCTDVYDHASLIFFRVDSHGNGICNRGLHHKNTVFSQPVAIDQIIICPLFDSRHIKWHGKIHVCSETGCMIDLFYYAVKDDLLQFQICQHTESHGRIYGNIRR